MNSSLALRPTFLALAVCLLAGVGCQTGPRPAAEFVQQAEQLHQSALQSTIIRDRDLDEYFAEIGKRIILGATAANVGNTRDPTFANMKFHLVDSDVVNAFGTGGGHIYVYNGLVQACQTEEELAALMAVQYAHALDLDIQRTGMKPDLRPVTDQASIDRVVYLYLTFPFSGTMSLEADKRAFEFYARGGWNPSAFAEAYERLRNVQRLDLPPTTGGDGQPRATLGARASSARSLASSLPAQSRDWRQPTVADPQTFSDLKRQAQNESQKIPDNTRAAFYLAAFPNVILPADLPVQQQAQGQLRRDVVPPAPPTPKIEPS
ncbi:M48 family metalloprotease [Humisphaera borealis]|uniref:M48 family metalloprotease n=1 Tax=Humisphaera borealis TaxID=2807512 RepID=A0A7M2WXZ3_9BACT|nr:M48 family metalloprotease [Humisphaera borealis]QOV90289.1 M48 family metalloprotease [Humisphaera borealis]